MAAALSVFMVIWFMIVLWMTSMSMLFYGAVEKFQNYGQAFKYWVQGAARGKYDLSIY